MTTSFRNIYLLADMQILSASVGDSQWVRQGK